MIYFVEVTVTLKIETGKTSGSATKDTKVAFLSTSRNQVLS